MSKTRSKLPPAPSWLSPAGRAEWNGRVAGGMTEIPDVDLFAVFCETFASWRRCAAQAARERRLPSESERETIRLLMQLSDRLGLNPRARALIDLRAVRAGLPDFTAGKDWIEEAHERKGGTR
jgi:phage terminase small subunit